MVVESPHLRSDAQRNLERILEAARAAFAKDGLDASVADVAALAGVGTATIFRRFPTKDDLAAEIVERELDRIRSRAEEAAASKDPATALAGFMEWAVEHFVEDRCICEASGSDLFTRPRIQELVGRVTAAVDLLLVRAQAAGAIRDDVVATDVGFLLNAIGLSAQALERTAPGAWRRYVAIVLDGLRPGGATSLTVPPPTTQQLHRSKLAGHGRTRRS